MLHADEDDLGKGEDDKAWAETSTMLFLTTRNIYSRIFVHKKAKESKKTGNAGKRLACCVIMKKDEEKEEKEEGKKKNKKSKGSKDKGE